MQIRFRLWAQLLLAVLLAVLAGCGGSGRGPINGGANGRTEIFITDDLNAGYQGVWVTINSIRLFRNGETVTVYENPDGTAVNLRELGDDGGRFLFLTNAELPVDTYSAIEIDLTREVRLQRTGETTSTEAIFDGSAPNRKTINLGFTPRQLGNGGRVVIDFDLANWSESAGVVTAPQGQFVKLANENGLEDESRHEGRIFEARVTALSGTAPNQTVTLADEGFAATVTTDSATTLYSYTGTTTALAIGQRVTVWGGYYPATRTVKAAYIRIEDGNAPEDDAVGTAANINPAGGSFDLELMWAQGFRPQSTSIRVQLAEDAEFSDFLSMSIDRETFFAQIEVDPSVDVSGVYDPNTNTFTAQRVRVTNFVGTLGAAAQARATQIFPDLGTIEVAAADVEALNSISPGRLQIVAGANTKFFGEVGNEITREAFFSGLAVGQSFEAAGVFDETTRTLSARQMNYLQLDGQLRKILIRRR